MPILLWKQGELRALRELAATDRTTTIPLLEIVEVDVDQDEGDDPDAPVGPYADLVDELVRAWGNEHCFIDLATLDDTLAAGGVHGVDRFFRLAALAGARAIPVVWLGASNAFVQAVQAVIARDGRGACIRVFADDVASPTFAADMQTLVGALRAPYTTLDVLIDWEAIDDGAAAQTFLTASALIQRLPNVAAWRSVSFGAGSMPNSLAGVGVGRSLIHRAEWDAYKQLLAAPPAGRLLSFADYCVAHPVYAPAPYLGAAAIRYTIDEDWLIYRGQSLRGPRFGGFTQFFGLAAQLVQDQEFRGPQFSWGDAQIALKARNQGTSGNLTTWRAIGTNHHIALVTRQLATYRVPAGGVAPPPVGP